MATSPNVRDLYSLLTELRILLEHAEARSLRKIEHDGFPPDYWRGVATGYHEAINRIEDLINHS